MGKIMVLYASAYGSTRRYAEYIANALGCKAVDIRRIKPQMMEEATTIIFGGWLCGGAVVGSSALEARRELLAGKHLIVFVTGAGEHAGTSRMNDIITSNFLALVPERVFYLRGNVCYRKMHWYHKFLINYLMFDDTNGERKWLKQEMKFLREKQADGLILYIKSR
ncbi:MAG: flavodoxin domain-containing protein [Clostridia bacterium]